MRRSHRSSRRNGLLAIWAMTLMMLIAVALAGTSSAATEADRTVKPSIAYLVIEGSIHDQVKWAEYRKAVVPLIIQYGGKHLTGAGKPELLEGAHPGRTIAIFAFPSPEAVHRFWRSPEYAVVQELRRGAADLEVWIVPGAK